VTAANDAGFRHKYVCPITGTTFYGSTSMDIITFEHFYENQLKEEHRISFDNQHVPRKCGDKIIVHDGMGDRAMSNDDLRRENPIEWTRKVLEQEQLDERIGHAVQKEFGQQGSYGTQSHYMRPSGSIEVFNKIVFLNRLTTRNHQYCTEEWS
jgi:hypothetical protein